MEVVSDIIRHFEIPDQPYRVKPFHQGLINDTYFIGQKDSTKYVLQRVNEEVFRNIEALMHNLKALLPYLDGPGYQKLSFVNTKLGDIFYRSAPVGTWRMMHFINGSQVHNICKDVSVAYEAGRILGRFHQLVPKPSSLELKETLEDFHNLERRVAQYQEALHSGVGPRIAMAGSTIEFVAQSLTELRKAPFQGLPLMNCHNDT